MILFKKAADLRNYLDAQRLKGVEIGFLPTMGGLHDGHISLVVASRNENLLTVCSIFVNPTQFNDAADLEKYPKTIEKDILELESNGCDLLFLPSVKEIYPAGTALNKKYELGYLESILEGKYRPGHFQGVCQVVDLLLDIVRPNCLYLGQKDYQQCMVIKKLLELTGRNEINLVICPTRRETDGLAMSSRNLRLDPLARSKAPIIHQALLEIRDKLETKKIPELKQKANNKLSANGFKIDYVEIADAENLQVVEDFHSGQKLVALAAASINDVRLIDNIRLN